jgi:hypothetical protein
MLSEASYHNMTVGRIPSVEGGIQPTIVDAKGDLIVATGNDSPNRLAVGANNLVLTADSAEATGLKWAAPDPLTTKGDLFTYSTIEARLGVGANDTVLTADSTAATGLKWALPSSGGMTLISTTTLTGASVTLSSIPSGYNDLYIVVQNYRPATDNQALRMRFNSDSNVDRHNGNTTYQQLGAGFTGTSFAISTGNDNTVATGLTTVTIPNYLNTSTWKMAFSYSMSVNANAPTELVADNYRGVYNQTGAITSLVLFPNSGNFTSGTVLLYGVK